MKTEVNKKSKTWIFSIPNLSLQKRVQGMLFLAMVTVLSVSCAETNLDVITEVNDQFDGIEAIEVDAGFLEMNYLGSDQQTEVSMEGIIRSNSDAYKIDYRVEGEVLRIRVIRNGVGKIGNFRSEGHLNLTGPKQMELKLEAGSGKVSVRNVSAEVIELHVGSGSVELVDAAADYIEMDASSGRVIGENLEGQVKAIVSSGRLTLQDIKGDVDAKGSSGNLSLSHVDGLVNAHTSSGKIELNRVSRLGSLVLSSGQISVLQSGLSAHTYLKASSGNMSVHTSSNLSQFNYDLVSGSGKVKVGDKQASGVLKIENGAPVTIKGEVNSGRIEIVN